MDSEHLRILIEHLPLSVAMFDCRMHYLAHSKRWCSENGIPEQDLRGLNHYEVFPTLSIEHRQAHARALAGESVKSDGDQCVFAAGAIKWIRWAIEPWRNHSGMIGGIQITTVDVTEATLATHKLIQRERILKAIFDQQFEFIGILDSNFQIVEFNDLALATFGLKANEIAGMNISDGKWWADSPEIKQRWNDLMVLAQQSVEPAITEFEYVMADGTRGIAETTISHMKDEQGRIQYYLVLAHDITQRKLAEDALADSERLFRQTIDSQLAAVYTTDEHGYILHYNKAYTEIAGNCPIVGKARWCSCNEVYRLDGSCLAPDEGALAIAIRTQKPVAGFEYCARSSDGQLRYFCAYAMPRFDEAGKIIGGVNTVIDITELRRTTTALRLSEHRLAAALDGGRMGIWDWDIESGQFECSDRVFQFFGHRLSTDDVDSVVNPFHCLHSDDQVEFDRVLCDTGKQGGAFYRELRVSIDESSNFRWLACAGRRTQVCENERTKVVGVIYDITERKNQEAKLQNFADELKESNWRKDVFLATLAHELRNPLAPIRNGLEIIKHSVNHPRVVEETRAMMARQTDLLMRLVDDLLDVARIASGKLELRRSRVSLSKVLNDAIEICQPSLSSSGHTFVLTPPRNTICLEGDEKRLAQILANLINNAIKYTHPPGRIEVVCSQVDSMAEIKVIDNGIGLSEEMIPRLFEAFYQVNPNGSLQTDGLGLGLSLAQALTTMHRGTLDVHSAGLNQGCTFTVRLPVLEDQRVGDGRLGTQSDSSGLVHKKVLVVDDNQVAAKSMSFLIEMYGYESRIVHDGEAACTEANSYRPDVILLDIGLPVLNGHQVAQWIRSQDWGKDIVLVALTGWGKEEDRKRSADAGFDLHLTKPADPEEVRKIIREYSRGQQVEASHLLGRSRGRPSQLKNE